MAYSNPSAPSNMSGLATAISTFAVAQGWTQDNYDGTNMKLSLHKGTCYVHFWWNDTHTDTNYPVSMAMYQSLGYSGSSVNQWEHTDDSGTGKADDTAPYDLQYERGIKYIGPGPYTSLHFFAHSDPDVIYGVLELSPGMYRHFAFGTIDKVEGSSWTGGEFVAGHHWSYTNGGPDRDNPRGAYHSLLMDGGSNGYYYGQDTRSWATMHVEGLPEQPTDPSWNQKYGCVLNLQNVDASDLYDRDGLRYNHIGGGMRDSIAIQQFGWLRPNLALGFIPVIPCGIWYSVEKGNSDDIYYLGKVPHMGTISLYGIDPQQVVTIGSNDWMAFPAVRKSYVLNNTDESWNMGIIYMK